MTNRGLVIITKFGLITIIKSTKMYPTSVDGPCNSRINLLLFDIQQALLHH